MMKNRTNPLFAGALLLLFVATTGMTSIGSKIPAFTLEDQNERSWERDDFNKKPVLYVLCDLDAYDYVDNWTKELVPKYKNTIHFVPVADVSAVPGLMKGYIRGRFEGEFTYPVLMDWDGILVEALGMKAGYPTLVITKADGTMTYHAWGKGSAGQIERLEKKLDEVTS